MPSSGPSRGNSWKGAIVQRADLDAVNDGPEKAVQIWSVTGRRPSWPALRFLVVHDDAEREFEYIAGAEKVLSIRANARLDTPSACSASGARSSQVDLSSGSGTLAGAAGSASQDASTAIDRKGIDRRRNA